VPFWNAREKRIDYRVTAEARAFLDAVAIFSRGRSITPSTESGRLKMRYALRVKVVLGKGERGDGDNFWKCIADGLQGAGVIHSDARVRIWALEVDDEDRQNPRTEIHAQLIGQTLWDLWTEFLHAVKGSLDGE
jgi:Holliday junction resolvase RusA-like endonuclease